MQIKSLLSFCVALILILNFNSTYSQCASEKDNIKCNSKCKDLAALEPTKNNHEAEINPQIPELSQYHEVIYQIWHSGWPNKDYDLLKSLYPDAEKGYLELQKVKLTGILQDKQSQWNDAVKKLGEYIEEYKSAIEKNDNQALLDAAEKVHSQYEQLVRLINPILKEMEEFHKSLYMLYHYDYPQYDLDKIQKDVAELSKKMEELNKAQLPKKYESMKNEFENKRLELDKAMKQLEQSIKEYENNKDAISKSIEEMHKAYQNLEGIFENK